MKRRHSRDELRELLGVIEDTHELVLRRIPEPTCGGPSPGGDELFAAWSAARAESNLAYDAWCAAPGAERYTIYLAAEDRADAAEAALRMPDHPAR